MKKSDWGVEVLKVGNGFVLKDNEGHLTVVEEKDGDELASAEELLWKIVEFFNLAGDKYDKERIFITRKTGERYTPPKSPRKESIVPDKRKICAVCWKETESLKRVDYTNDELEVRRIKVCPPCKEKVKKSNRDTRS